MGDLGDSLQNISGIRLFLSQSYIITCIRVCALILVCSLYLGVFGRLCVISGHFRVVGLAALKMCPPNLRFLFFCLLFTVKQKRLAKYTQTLPRAWSLRVGGTFLFQDVSLSPSFQNRRSDERTDKIRGKLRELQKIAESVNKVSVFVIIFHSIGKVIDGVRTHTCCLLGEERRIGLLAVKL